MRVSPIVAACCIALTFACRPARMAKSTATIPERTVFTDSAMHAERCATVEAGVDWRKVCTPKDQGVQPRRKP
jgi:hypothetical protein